MTITLYDFDLSFPKLLLKIYFLWAFKLQGMSLIFYNLKAKSPPVLHSRVIPVSFFLSSVCLCILCHKHYQCPS